mmetsp:Transcript_51832/g.125108  ORF Transcript_51832/g.125108 Transcript_51832/m.125108 type:complete len:203 (-) Transcript_51832:1568-2176(-)
MQETNRLHYFPPCSPEEKNTALTNTITFLKTMGTLVVSCHVQVRHVLFLDTLTNLGSNLLQIPPHVLRYVPTISVPSCFVRIGDDRDRLRLLHMHRRLRRKATNRLDRYRLAHALLLPSYLGSDPPGQKNIEMTTNIRSCFQIVGWRSWLLLGILGSYAELRLHSVVLPFLCWMTTMILTKQLRSVGRSNSEVTVPARGITH